MAGSNNGSIRDAQPSSILSLPAELRLHIFENLLKNFMPISLFIQDNVYVWGRGLPPDFMSYLLVCKEINKELQDFMWTRLTFTIRAQSGRGVTLARCIGSTATCELLRKIRHVEVMVPFVAIGGKTSKELFQSMWPCLAVIERSDALRSITFNCDSSLWMEESKKSREALRAVARLWKTPITQRVARGTKFAMSNTRANNARIVAEVFADVETVAKDVAKRELWDPLPGPSKRN